MRKAVAMLAVLALVVLSGCGAKPANNNGPSPSLEKTVDGMKFALSTNPATPTFKGPTTLTLTLTTASGTPVQGALVQMTGDMSGHAMQPVQTEMQESGKGTYVGEVQFGMAGDWRVKIEAGIGGKISLAEFAMKVSDKAANSAAEEAPDFTVTTLDGKQISLRDLRGTPVMLDFMATWCHNCQLLMKQMVPLYAKYKEHMVILSIDIDASEPDDVIRKFMKDNGATWAVAKDTTGKIAQAYRVKAIPQSVFIDPTGKIQKVSVGKVEKTEEMAKVIESMMAAYPAH